MVKSSSVPTTTFISTLMTTFEVNICQRRALAVGSNPVNGTFGAENKMTTNNVLVYHVVSGCIAAV